MLPRDLDVGDERRDDQQRRTLAPLLVGETKYARSADGLRLAYQQWGEGPPLLIVPALLSNVEVAWEHELYRRVLEYIGRYMTCAQFDKRGIGLSDRPDELPTLEQRIGDIVAVMDAVGWERAHLLGMSEGGIMSQLFAADYPGAGRPPPAHRHGQSHRATGIASAASCEPGDAPVLPTDELYANFGRLVEGWPENSDYFVDWFMPSEVDDESYVRWFGRLQRLSASPKDFAHQVESVLDARRGRRAGADHARRRW